MKSIKPIRLARLKMMTGIFVLALLACAHREHKVVARQPTAPADRPSYIVFGRYCGECSLHCATMYRYNMMGNVKTLFVDSTDSYFVKPGQMVFHTEVNGAAKFKAVENLVQQIPQSLLEKQPHGPGVKSDEISERFGCPDCSDGCGFYLEMQQDKLVKKFYIDTDLTVLPKDIADLAVQIKNTLAVLSK